MDREQGTTHANAYAADGAVFTHMTVGSAIIGSTFNGSSATFKNINGSNITGSTLALPNDGALGGMSEVVTGTTAAASLNGSFNHSLGVTPSWVGLTAHGTNGSNTINLVTKGTGQIIVESALGTVAFEALVLK